MKKLNKKAFTLIELLVVIAIIGILVLFGAPRFTGHTQKAELTRIQHDIKVMEQEVGTVLINQDDDFNKWEDNNKDFNQLIQEGKLFEKEGVAYEEPIDGPYKVIPEEYKDKINTKLKGTFYANSGGKVYYEHTKPLVGIPTESGEKGPGYSDEEIKDLIENHKFIPVATAEDLNSIRNHTERTYGAGTKWEGPYTGGYSKKYVQVKDVDLSGYSAEEGWMPIGTSYRAEFKGSFNGNGYKITGLTINRPTQESVGLFGYTHGAAISNVALEGVNITGNKQVGGLVGHAGQGSDGQITTISNSYTTGSVTGFINVGGLVGQAFSGSKISNSYSTGEVSGATAGGLVGWANSASIKNSYATGEVTGEVTGEHYVGGLVGGAGGSLIENSYATGSVTGVGGGLVGYADTYTTISNSYWDTVTTGKYESAGQDDSFGKLTVDMMDKDTYLGWDFDEIWEITPENYPTLR